MGQNDVTNSLDPSAVMADIGKVFDTHGVPEQLRLGMLIGLVAGALNEQGHDDKLVKEIIAKAVDTAMATGR